MNGQAVEEELGLPFSLERIKCPQHIHPHQKVANKIFHNFRPLEQKVSILDTLRKKYVKLYIIICIQQFSVRYVFHYYIEAK